MGGEGGGDWGWETWGGGWLVADGGLRTEGGGGKGGKGGGGL